ncbi:MAG TPA: ABC transporter substrate-binding protein [Chloroflexota bacterium]|nr:ABC transporter substrate-binding protein [Chloroflexota bacterium]
MIRPRGVPELRSIVRGAGTATGLLLTLVGLAGCAAPPAASLGAPAAEPSTSHPAAAASTAASPTAAPSPPPALGIKLAVTDPTVSLIPNAVMWLAKDLGFYEREGLDVDLMEMSGTPLAIAALLSGQADVANIGVPEVIELVATGKADLRAVHSPNARQYFLLAGNGDLRTPHDLKGRTFGIARVGSVDHTQSMIVMKSFGVDPAIDITFIGVGEPQNRAKALVAGNVDATSFSVATWEAIRQEPNVRVLLDADAYYRQAPFVSKVNAAPMAIIQSKPEELTRLTRALMAASRHLAQSQQAWVDGMVARRPELDRDELAELWSYYGSGWGVNGLMNLDDYRQTARFLAESGTVPSGVDLPVERWATTRFVDRALADLGIYPGLDDPGRPIAGATRP